MRRSTGASVLLAGALLVSACASSGATGGGSDVVVVERSRTSAGFDRSQTMELSAERSVHAAEFAVPARRVYDTLLAVAESLGLPLESSRPGEGIATFLLQQNRMRIDGRPASAYVDCGHGPTGPRANSYRVSMRVAAVVETKEPAGARFRATVAATARDQVTSSAELNCTSTGRLERMLAEGVAERLGT